MQQTNFLIMARRLILLGVSFGMLGGCVIFDDLEVENRFAFPILLRRQSRNLQKKSVLEKIGWISEGETVLFEREGGPNGQGPDEIEIVSGNGRSLGTLEQFTLSKVKGNAGCSQSSTWHISIGGEIPVTKKPDANR